MEDKKRKCWECRRRRLVCDLARPGCAKCQSAGRSCPGYSTNKPLKWMQPPEEIKSRHAPRRRLECASSTSSVDSQESALDFRVPDSTSTAESPVLPLEKPDEPPDDICQNTATFMSDPCALKVQHGLDEIHESVQYWNTIICPDLVATGKGGGTNPFFLPTCIVSQLPRSAVLTVVSTAIGHRLLQSGALPALASERPALATKLRHHRGASIQALTADLAQQDKQLSDGTLGAVLALLLFEIQQTFSPTWHHHLHGATTIINLRGGLGHLIVANPSFRFIYGYYAIIDIIRLTTSPSPLLLTVTTSHLALLPLLPILFSNGLHTSFPCPPSLLALIIRINHLRAQAANAAPQDRHTCALPLLHEIQSSTATLNTWALAAAFETDARDFGAWQAVARIFQCAVGVYCISSLLHDTTTEDRTTTTPTTSTDTSSDSTTTIDASQSPAKTLLATSRTRLVQLLREMHAHPHLRRMLLWPVVVAGIGAKDEVERGFVEGELGWISKTAGTAAPLVARGFLREKVWDVGLGRSVGKDGWDGMFEGSEGLLFGI